MQKTITIQGRELTDSDLEFPRQLQQDHPLWSLRRLSQEVCKAWGWRSAKGELKDMACRTMMLKLDVLGEITLPPRRQTPSNRMMQRSIVWVDHDTTPVHAPLCDLQPLNIQQVSTTEDEALFSCLLSEHHYLGYRSSVAKI